MGRGEHGQGLWTGGDSEARGANKQDGSTRGRQAQTECGKTLRTRGRGQVDKRASIWHGPHPGTQRFIPLFPQ